MRNLREIKRKISKPFKAADVPYRNKFADYLVKYGYAVKIDKTYHLKEDMSLSEIDSILEQLKTEHYKYIKTLLR